MLRNLHPADELAIIRQDIRRLKERETFLRNGFLNDKFARYGTHAIADVAPMRRRTFLKEKLPEHILNDERYWRTDIIHHVRIQNAPQTPARRRH